MYIECVLLTPPLLSLPLPLYAGDRSRPTRRTTSSRRRLRSPPARGSTPSWARPESPSSTSTPPRCGMVWCGTVWCGVVVVVVVVWRGVRAARCCSACIRVAHAYIGSAMWRRCFVIGVATKTSQQQTFNACSFESGIAAPPSLKSTPACVHIHDLSPCSRCFVVAVDVAVDVAVVTLPIAETTPLITSITRKARSSGKNNIVGVVLCESEVVSGARGLSRRRWSRENALL